MIFFLDENFPKRAEIVLQSHGHTVFDIRGTSDEGKTDPEIFRMAKNKKAVFLTTDKDFFHTIHYSEKPHYGILVIALRKPNSESIMAKLNWALENLNQFTFENSCLLLTDGRCTVFR